MANYAITFTVEAFDENLQLLSRHPHFSSLCIILKFLIKEMGDSWALQRELTSDMIITHSLSPGHRPTA